MSCTPHSRRYIVERVIHVAGKVLVYTDGLDQTSFVANGLTYDATLRNLELIGEAATHIPSEVRAAVCSVGGWR
jgi:uncharacterized protein with HEPN domain